MPSPSPYRILNLFKTSLRQVSQTRENRFSMRLVLSIPGNNQPQNTLFSINCVRQDHGENGSLQEHARISAIKVKRDFNPLRFFSAGTLPTKTLYCCKIDHSRLYLLPFNSLHGAAWKLELL